MTSRAYETASEPASSATTAAMDNDGMMRGTQRLGTGNRARRSRAGHGSSVPRCVARPQRSRRALHDPWDLASATGRKAGGGRRRRTGDTGAAQIKARSADGKMWNGRQVEKSNGPCLAYRTPYSVLGQSVWTGEAGKSGPMYNSWRGPRFGEESLHLIRKVPVNSPVC